MKSTKESLFIKIRFYKKLSEELQVYLSNQPNEWPKFQDKFNSALEEISKGLMKFEKENIEKYESKIYKLKRIFEERYKRYFLYGDLVLWSYKKPYGYPGDFKIIFDIYQNQAQTIGYSRLWDNYYQQMHASIATRERKDDFKNIILDFLKTREDKNVRIMNLASGPAKEIQEVLDEDKKHLFSNVVFDCYDYSIESLDFAKHLLNAYKNINFIQKNAIRIAFKKEIKKEIPYEYDLIYSTGLFDYLDERVAMRLVSNLRTILKQKGSMVISNYREKKYNPSAHLMEWVTEWNLIYRSEGEFKKVFIDGGFSEDELKIIIQRCGVIQYCFATKR